LARCGGYQKQHEYDRALADCKKTFELELAAGLPSLAEGTIELIAGICQLRGDGATGVDAFLKPLRERLQRANASEVKNQLLLIVAPAMADLKARTEKLGLPRIEGKDLYFGMTKIEDPSDVVNAIAKDHSVAATLFVTSPCGSWAKNVLCIPSFVRVATTLKQKDGSSAVGTSLELLSPALAKLIKGEFFYGDATVFGESYAAGYEPIKDASGAVVGAYFVGRPRTATSLGPGKALQPSAAPAASKSKKPQTISNKECAKLAAKFVDAMANAYRGSAEVSPQHRKWAITAQDYYNLAARNGCSWAMR
jgi:hypothetical protein